MANHESHAIACHNFSPRQLPAFQLQHRNLIYAKKSMGTSINNVVNSPTTTAIALVAVTSALAISFNIHKSKKIMSTEKDSAATGDPQLPNPNFVTGSFKNSRSQSLFTLNLPPKDTSSSPPKAMLVLVHGVAEHCCRAGYIGLYESLSEAGVDVYSYDHHGHGRSEGEPRVYCEKFDDYVTDLLDYIKHIQSKYTEKGGPAPPLVLCGQSMGALISAMAVLRLGSYHVGGVIMTSSALGVDMNMGMKIQKMFAPAIDKFVPKARIVDGVRPEDMSRSPEAVQAYIDDPLCIKGNLVARTAIQMDKSFNVVQERRGEITCPILMVHGTGDQCTSINASRKFFQNVGTPLANKKFLQLPGMYHELLEEPESDQLMISIVEFASTGGKQFAAVKGEENDSLVDVILS